MLIPDKLLNGQPHEMPIEVLLSKAIQPTALDGLRVLLGFKLPSWQRQEVWPVTMKQRFIEGIFLGVGTGSYVVTAKDWDRNGVEKPMSGWLIDGQQRLSAIRDFVNGKFSIFSDVCWGDIDPIVARKRFLRVTFPSIELSYQPDEAKLRELYERMNFTAVVAHAASDMQMQIEPEPEALQISTPSP